MIINLYESLLSDSTNIKNINEVSQTVKKEERYQEHVLIKTEGNGDVRTYDQELVSTYCK